MTKIEFKIDGQVITKKNDKTVVEKSRNEYTAVFDFDDTWTDVENKQAYFTRYKDGLCVKADIDESGTCQVPWEVIEMPMFYVSVAGGNLKTVTRESVFVEQTGYRDDAEKSGTVPEVIRTPQSISLQNGTLLLLDRNNESVGEGLEVSSLFGNHKRTIVNCPAFTNQPTVEGDLKEEFKPWNETYYFVHILDSTAGTFQLMALKNDTSTVIDQTFTLADLNTGNSGTLKENSPVDFISVGTDWKMRSAGVAAISFNLSKATNVDLKLSGYSNISGYFHINYLNGFNALDYMYSGSLSKIYLGNSGFLFSVQNIVGKNVFVSMNAKINIGQKTMNVCGSCSAQQMKDEDIYANQSAKTVLPIVGTCWRKGNADFETAYISGFQISIDGILRNGFEIEVTGRE